MPQLHRANKTIVVPIKHLGGLLDLLFAIWAMHLAHCAFTLRSWVWDSFCNLRMQCAEMYCQLTQYDCHMHFHSSVGKGHPTHMHLKHI